MSGAFASSRVPELLNLAQTLSLYEGELMRRSGAQFNLLKILKIGHLEARTHSPILAELLNPKGSHGYGAAFLDLFVQELKLGRFDAEGATVDLEFYIGPVTDLAGGRVDILIRSRQSEVILIENKIHAGEQLNQWKRYVAFAESGKTAHLLFLTLHEDRPKSIDQVQTEKIRCISYEKHIRCWLEACKKEAADSGSVREAINQYLHLVKELTHQNISNRMNEEIAKAVLATKESFDAYHVLRGAEQTIWGVVVEGLHEKLSKVGASLGLEYEDGGVEGGGPTTGFGFSNKAMEAFNLSVWFEFQSGGHTNLCFGFCDESKLSPKDRELLKQEFAKEFGSPRQTGWWPAWMYWDAYRNWDSETWWEIYRGGEFFGDLKGILRKHVAAFEAFVSQREAASLTVGEKL